MPEVKVTYSDYLNSVTDEISFELVTDIILNLKYEKILKSVTISMADKITDNTQLTGTLDFDGLNTLIKTLTIIRNQIKEGR